ncbi:PREDICTED: uncharacterized protein LOC106804852 [Priapulus caudatus]|uniref:Uncharacterized protein LOC106804852 n=1 Tax=Priapulus caudatus TaxID=37621 RepID=A0ABM1DP26_PRICU|nr:PREDICTED: uncharacterized protein LOC106804852 [Priapulus caudatus]
MMIHPVPDKPDGSPVTLLKAAVPAGVFLLLFLLFFILGCVCLRALRQERLLERRYHLSYSGANDDVYLITRRRHRREEENEDEATQVEPNSSADEDETRLITHRWSHRTRPLLHEREELSALTEV